MIRTAMAMVSARWTSPVAATQPMNVASGSHVDHGSVKPGRAVGDAPVRRASGFRRLHHLNHLGQERVLCSGRGRDRERARQVERAGLKQGARARRLRNAFAGDERTIDIGLSLQDPAIDRDALSGRQQDSHARLDLASVGT